MSNIFWALHTDLWGSSKIRIKFLWYINNGGAQKGRDQKEGLLQKYNSPSLNSLGKQEGKESGQTQGAPKVDSRSIKRQRKRWQPEKCSRSPVR